MVGIQWPDSVTSQAGPNGGRSSRPSSNVGIAPKADVGLARSPSWPQHGQRGFRPEDVAQPPPPAYGELVGGELGVPGIGVGDGASSASASRSAEKQASKSPTPPSERRDTQGLGPLPLRGGHAGAAAGRGAAMGGAAYPGSVQFVPETTPVLPSVDGFSDPGVGAPRPGRQAVDAVLRRPEGELTPSGTGEGASAAGTRGRLATVVEASPPATVEHVPDGSATTGPELMDTERSPGPSTYSDTRDSQSRSPMRRSRDGDGSGDTRSNASRRRDKLRLPDFMVHMPAGSGCGQSDLPCSSTFIDVEKGSYTMESQGVVRPTPSCRRCLEFEAKIKALRAEHAEDLARERNERQAQVHALEEKLRRALAQASEEEGRLRKEIEALQAGSGALEAAEASMAELRKRLQSEEAVAESVSRYQQETVEARSAKNEAEQQRDEAKRRFDGAKRQAAECERQRRDLAKQSGTQEAQRLRGELEAASKERAELVKKLKKVVPHVQALQAEEARLQQRLEEQTDLAAKEGRAAKTESQEMQKVKDSALRQKKSLQSQVGAVNSELEESKGKLKEAQGALAQEQRQRLDENRKQQNAKAEIKRLRAELENTETALQQQAQVATAAAAAAAAAGANGPQHQHWGGDPRLTAAVEQREAAQRGRPPPPAAGTGPVPGSFTPVRAGGPAPVARARVGAGVASGGSAGTGGTSTSSAARGGTMTQWPQDAEADRFQDFSAMDLAAAQGLSAFEPGMSEALPSSPGSASIYQNGVGASRSDSPGEQPWMQVGGGFVATPDSPSRYGPPGSPIMGSGGVANNASARLFEVIEKAKVRADQRRLLSGAAEEVKVKAQALEELLECDVAAGLA